MERRRCLRRSRPDQQKRNKSQYRGFHKVMTHHSPLTTAEFACASDARTPGLRGAQPPAIAGRSVIETKRTYSSTIAVVTRRGRQKDWSPARIVLIIIVHPG